MYIKKISILKIIATILLIFAMLSSCLTLSAFVFAEDNQNSQKAEKKETGASIGENNRPTKAEPVKKVDARSKTKGKYIIRWSRSKNADGYFVQMSKYRKGKYSTVKKISNAKKNSYTHKNKKLSKNKKYYYKVVSYKVIDGKKLVTKTKTSDSVKNTLRYKKSFKVRATAYSGGGYCANGKRVTVGRIAVDPSVIPLGTWMYVKGYGLCQACDTGGAIKGRKIDVYFNKESKCNRWGVRGTKVYILK